MSSDPVDSHPSFDTVDFLERAVRTPSHEDVTEMRDLLVDAIESASSASRDAEDAAGETAIPVTVDDAGNTLATRDSGRPGPHVVLNTHVDTVPPHVPFSRERDSEDVIRGRGSCDAKGPLAALLAAFLDAPPERGRVTLAVTPDEETNSTGAAALDFESRPDLGPAPDAVIVGEPTGLDVCTAAKGRFQATVTVRGANAHAAEPDEGENAVRAAGDVLAAIDSFDDRPDRPGGSDALGAPTLVPTTVEGGTATNQVPAECSFVVDRRSVPPETAEGFRSTLADHLRTHAPEGVAVEVTLAERDTPFLAAFETSSDAAVVRALRDASGGEVRPFGAATEASYFAELAPTVVFGPGALADDEGGVAHAPREYVRVSEVERAAVALRETLAALVG